MTDAARLVVPFGREGASDRAARVFAQAYDGAGGLALAIENAPGGGGLAGVQRANEAAAAGDRVLMLATPTTQVLLPARLGAEAGLHGVFEPALGFGGAPNVLLASSRLGVGTLDGLVARSRAERLVYASAGAGQTIHLCTALWLEMAGLEMEHRSFERGSVLAYAELAAGRVHVYFDNLLGCRDRIDAGEVVALAVSSTQRHPLLPSTPTLEECGYPGHALDVWMGIYAANMGSQEMRRMDALHRDAAFAKGLHALGLAGGPLAAAGFARQVDESRAAWHRAFAAARS